MFLRLLKLKEAGELYGVSPHTLRRWARIGKLPVVRLGGRTVRFRPEDLESVVRAKLVPAREQVR